MRHKKLMLLAGLVLGGTLLWLALRDVDLQSLGRTLTEANLWLVGPFLAILVAFYWLKARRWSVLLSPAMPLSAWQLMPSMMVGFAGNNIMPARLGELLRIYLLTREQSLPASLILGTVALERLFDAAAILLIVALTVSLVPVISSEFAVAGYALLAVVSCAALLVYGVVASPEWLLNLGRSLASPFPERWAHVVATQLASIRAGFASINSVPVILRVFINSIAQWSLMVLCIHTAMLAFQLSVSPAAAVVVLALLVVGISLPNAPAFVGTIEYCFVAGLGLFGIEPTIALGAAIFYHALSFVFVTLSGLYFIRRYSTSLRGLQDNARTVRSVDS